MSPRTSLFALLAVLGIAWIAAGARSLGEVSPPGPNEFARSVRTVDESNPDVFQGTIEAKEYLRNPDLTARILFANYGGPVHLTVCGTKNLALASSLLPETGPLELRVGSEAGAKTQVVARVARNQPVWAVRCVIPGSENGEPVNLYLWNDDRDRDAKITYRLLVGDAAR